MKVLLTALVALFSFTAAFAAENSAVEKLKTLKSSRELCDSNLKKVKGWPDRLNRSQLAEAGKIVSELSSPPSEDDLKTIQAALKESPAESLDPYFSLMGKCGLMRSSLADRLIATSKDRGASPDQKENARKQLVSLLKNRTYETYIDAMVNASILSKIYTAKLFTVDKDDPAKLKESKDHLKEEADRYQKELKENFAEIINKNKVDAEALKKNPNYEAHKSLFFREIEHSGHVLMTVRVLASKLK